MATLTKSAGSGSSVNRDGKSSWSNAGYVTTEDSSYASVSISKSSYSSWLYASNFSFGIPDDSIVTGIVATIKKYGNSSSSVKDSVVQLCDGSGTLIGSNQAVSTAWPSSNGNTTYGSSTSLWGVSSLKGSDVNAAGFGVKISAANSASNSSNSAYVDYVSLAITYTPIYTGVCSDGLLFTDTHAEQFAINTLCSDGVYNQEQLANGMSYDKLCTDELRVHTLARRSWDLKVSEGIKHSESYDSQCIFGGKSRKIDILGDVPASGVVQVLIRVDDNNSYSATVLDESADK